MISQNKINLPVCILNIGGIANITAIGMYKNNDFISQDLGPGNCLIDMWIRQNIKKKYDKDGAIAKSGKINKIILEKIKKNF